MTLALAGVTLLVLLLSVPGSLRDAFERGGIYLFSRAFLEDIPKRLTGPGRFRFVMQPAVAILLGIRSGLADARAGRPAYLFALLFREEERRELLRSGFETVVNLVLMGVLLDAIFQRWSWGRCSSRPPTRWRGGRRTAPRGSGRDRAIRRNRASTAESRLPKRTCPLSEPGAGGEASLTTQREGVEGRRLAEARERGVAWRKWGPYLSERQWGTVRQYYGDNGDAWGYFTHDQARSRAYRGRMVWPASPTTGSVCGSACTTTRIMR